MPASPTPARQALDLAVSVLEEALDMALAGTWRGVEDRKDAAMQLLEANRLLSAAGGYDVSEIGGPADAPVLVLLAWSDDHEGWRPTPELFTALHGDRAAARRIMDSLLAATARAL